MSWKRSTLFLFLMVFAGAMSLATTAAAQGPCSAEVVNTVSPPDQVTGHTQGPPAPASSGNGGTGLYVPAATVPILNQEGLTERPADLLMWDNGTGTCFKAGEQIIITYNASLTTPNPVANNGSDIDVMDSAGTSGLVVSVATSVGLSTFNTPQTVITISVLQAGTAGDLLTGYTGSAVRLKNLRFDVTSLATSSGGKNVQATISTSNPVTAVTSSNTQSSGSALLTVGTVSPTRDTEFYGNNDGFGFQSTPPGLCDAGSIWFADNFGGGFRTAITSQAVYSDVPTGDMSLIFNVTNIPSGVTVTFPSTIANSGSLGANLVFTARSSTLTATGGSLAVIYDTTTSDPSFLNGIEVDSDNTASTVTSTNYCDIFDCVGPKIGVAVGSVTDTGTASIEAIFGPNGGPGPAAFTGDDVNSSAIPRYISNTSPTAPSRLLEESDFFTIAPVETVLLYPYVTDTLGFQTGLEIANTGNSSHIFSAPPCSAPATNGSLTFYFFPNGGTPFSYTPTAADQAASNGAIRGLDTSTGVLNSGNIFAATLDGLLTADKQTSMIGNFDGYVMVVTQFNYAHGIGLVLSQSTGATVMSSNALVVGPYEGERQGVASGLPEALKSVTIRKR